MSSGSDADAIGIDGCPGGWIAAVLTGRTVTWRFAEVDRIGELVPPDVVVGIDMPIGLLESGDRQCDALARQALPGAASRVFTTPPRAVLEAGPTAPNDVAQALARELSGRGVSRQALNLAPRILALDAHLATLPTHRAIEVHPEVSFAELAGRVLARKKSTHGEQERRQALVAWLPDVDALLGTRPRAVPVNDALDALAALWSAERWRDGVARTIPAGARMAPFIAV